MALINCHECGERFSDSADKCPHCGAETKFAAIMGVLGSLVGTFVLIAVCFFFKDAILKMLYEILKWGKS